MTQTEPALETPRMDAGTSAAAAAAPLLPSADRSEASADALEDLHRFHLAPPDDADLGADILPALLHGSGARPAGEYPLFLPPTEGGEGASYLALSDLLLRAVPEDADAGPLRDRLDDLARHVRRAVASRRQPRRARPVLEEAGKALVAEAGASAEALAAALERLLAAVPEGGLLLPFSDQASLQLLMHAARGRLRPAREAFRAEVRHLEAQAQALLGADRNKRPESRESGVVTGAMGALGSRYVDPSALAEVLDERRGGTEMPERRRQQLEDALAALTGYLGAQQPALILVHDGLHGVPGCETLASGPEAGGWRVERSEDPCAAAAEIFDREAEAVARVLRAARRVRLEADGKYDPGRQDPWLESFDWQAFSRQELLLLPSVVALVAADRVARRQMASLSSLLLSGRPVQVLMPVEPSANPGFAGGGEASGEPLSGFRFEPAYLGLAHREALVQQTCLSRPAHAMEGFDRALAATHAGLHVVASLAPSGGDEPLDSEARAAAAVSSRAHPLFRYDPEAGPSWADRLDFTHNPEPEVDWPVRQLAVCREDGEEETLRLPFTFADFALLVPAFARQFRRVPDGVPEVELEPMAEAVNRPLDDGTAPIPYVWGVEGDSRLVRLAVSRPLALACRDRQAFWRTLQEMAGVRSEYVRRAEARSRRKAEEAAAKVRAELEARHAAELDRVREDAARDVVDRLTAALLEVDVATFAGPAPAGALAGLATGSVDEVAAALLELVNPATLDEEASGGGGDAVDRVASELLGLVGDA